MTRRTKAELDVLFANNSTGDISPQDLRDLVDSLTPGHGSIMLVTPLPTTIPGAGQYVKANGTTQLSTQTMHRDFTMPMNNRLMWSGITSVHCHVVSSLSMSSGGNNVDIGVKLTKNGVEIDHSNLRRKISTGADIGSTAIHGDFQMNPGDYVELYVANLTNTSTITLEEFYLFIVTMLM